MHYSTELIFRDLLERLKSGHINWDVIAENMDDDTREYLHSQLAPCSDYIFLEAYLIAHHIKFNEDFILN